MIKFNCRTSILDICLRYFVMKITIKVNEQVKRLTLFLATKDLVLDKIL